MNSAKNHAYKVYIYKNAIAMKMTEIAKLKAANDKIKNKRDAPPHQPHNKEGS